MPLARRAATTAPRQRRAPQPQPEQPARRATTSPSRRARVRVHHLSRSAHAHRVPASCVACWLRTLCLLGLAASLWICVLSAIALPGLRFADCTLVSVLELAACIQRVRELLCAVSGFRFGVLRFWCDSLLVRRCLGRRRSALAGGRDLWRAVASPACRWRSIRSPAWWSCGRATGRASFRCIRARRRCR